LEQRDRRARPARVRPGARHARAHRVSHEPAADVRRRDAVRFLREVGGWRLGIGSWRLGIPNPHPPTSSRYCTFACTLALPDSVKGPDVGWLPPLEQAPDQIAERPPDTVSVTDPAGSVADPVPPTDTLMPAGFDVTLCPLRPDADTVRVALPDEGG